MKSEECQVSQSTSRVKERSATWVGKQRASRSAWAIGRSVPRTGLSKTGLPNHPARYVTRRAPGQNIMPDIGSKVQRPRGQEGLENLRGPLSRALRPNPSANQPFVRSLTFVDRQSGFYSAQVFYIFCFLKFGTIVESISRSYTARRYRQRVAQLVPLDEEFDIGHRQTPLWTLLTVSSAAQSGDPLHYRPSDKWLNSGSQSRATRADGMNSIISKPRLQGGN